MAEKTFKLEIVTPRRVVYSGDVVSFSAPGTVGNFQVLYNHAPLLSSLTIGEAKLTDAEGKEAHFATSGGFVEVMGNRVVMLAETAERIDEIDIARAERAKERAQARLATHAPGVDEDRARIALQRAINRLRIAHRD